MNFRCAVLGNPIAHSKSPAIHAKLAAKYHIPLTYDRILVPNGSFKHIVRDFFIQGGRGLNITFPCKEEAFYLADCHSKYAQYARAANTLWMKDNKLQADITDGRGLMYAIEKMHGYPLAGRRVVLIGAGSTARACILPLLQAGITQLDILNRTVEKAFRIIADYADVARIPMRALSLNHQALDGGYDVLINATSTGLDNTVLPLSPSLIAQTKETFCYEMVYGRQTAFLSWAKRYNACYCADGLSMLKAQAQLSFHIWFEKEIGS